MSTLVYFLFLVFPAISSQAQQRYTSRISGQVKDIQNEPVPAASLQLLLAKDSSVHLSAIASNNGQFEITGIGQGQYLLAVSAVGMASWYSQNLNLDSTQIHLKLPLIILHPLNKKQLQEVVVTAKKPLIEYDLDKTIVNVESMIGASTGNTLEVLEKTPGVSVDANGEISLYGAGGVTVLIDGRPTYMSGRDLTAYLRSLPGSMLDKIELITNPPAKYDANGGALINIRFKKKRTHGYAGSAAVSASQGKLLRNYNSINLNYLQGKTNIFTNIAYSRYTDINESTDSRAFYANDGQKERSSEVLNEFTARNHEFSARLGLDYNLTKKTTIGFIVNGSTRSRKDVSEYNSYIFSNGKQPDSTGIGKNDITGQFQQLGANTNFQHKFNEKGEELTADLNYISYRNTNNQWLNNFVRYPSGETGNEASFMYNLPNRTDVLTGKVDYSLPLKNKSSFATGIKSSYVKNDHQSDYNSYADEQLQPDPGRSNHFIYEEYIQAAYVNGRKDWKRFGIQLGARWEHTHTMGNQLGNSVVPASVFKRDYHSFFPTFFSSVKLDSAGKHVLSLSMSRRINRPGYSQLNPFLFFNDQYSYSTGNPFLSAAYSNRADINWRYKQWLSTRLLFDQQTDGIATATKIEDNIQISRAENFARRTGIALIVSINANPIKWLTLNGNAGVANFSTKGQIYDQQLDLSIYTWRVHMLSQVRFGKDWSAELFMAYNAPNVEWQRLVKSRSWANMAIQKKILKGKGSLKLNFEDLFRSQGFREEAKGLVNAYALRNNTPDTRRVGISFSYNFGKETFARKRKYNDNTADDLKERAQ